MISDGSWETQGRLRTGMGMHVGRSEGTFTALTFTLLLPITYEQQYVPTRTDGVEGS